jgi:DNA-binding SARP family transcriptional activator
MRTMSITVHLLGRPCIEVPGETAYRFRSQKSWGLLAYLLLTERPPSRSHLCELLFDAADDPLRALRWSLAEIRRGLGEGARLEGDPVVVSMPATATIDVDVVTHGSWRDAVGLPGLGSELLALLTPRGAAGFESWLQAERRRVAAASEAILHEAAVAALSAGDMDAALDYGVRCLAMNPLDENAHALVIRLHRRRGDVRSARVQYESCAALLRDQLGVEPGVVVESALREEVPSAAVTVNRASVEAILEAGSAAVAAGATSSGVATLRTAVRLADDAGDPSLRMSSRLVLAEALIHSIRGLDEEGIAALHAADRLADEHGDHAVRAEARTELGYVDFLRARYDRAEHWLASAIDMAADAPSAMARALMYLGSVESDRADYPSALAHLDRSAGLLRASGEPRRLAYILSMRGRIHLLRGERERAADDLQASIEEGERERWLAFLPWPQALLGESALLSGRVDVAEELLEQAFARACQLGDPCWEGMSARGTALVAEARGEPERAFDLLSDARLRCNRVADPYVWLDAYILDAQCTLGRKYGHPDTRQWVETMQTLAARTSMREMIVRSLLHGAALGDTDAARGAAILADSIENLVVQDLVKAAVRT